MPDRTQTLLTILAIAVIALLQAGGCRPGERACTMADCDDGVAFELKGIDSAEGSITVETCIGNACRTQPFQARSGSPPGPSHVLRSSPPGTYEPGDRLPVSATVIDAEGNEVAAVAGTVSLEEHQPNGPRCPPTCAQATVEVSPGTRPGP